jgi:2,3,4,5-tetrahydropyridine-2-carboxylate N-succinyltransferase
MVEGRISSSAIGGAGSDVAGGASILGVLSGTAGNPISIGENTLLGANSTCGIPLGDACIIDGGVAIFAGTKVKVAPEELAKITAANPEANLDSKTTFRADEFQGLSGLHFRQNSTTGEIIVRRSTREVKLNADLH